MPYVKNGEVRIHYEVEGQGPPLMLVHGMSGSVDSWRTPGYVDELKKDNQLILIDVRGFGASDKPYDSSAYEFQQRVGDLVAVLDDLSIEKTNYFGYSMGGKIGFRIPTYAPDRFNCLILGGMGYPLTGKEEKEDGNAIQTQKDLETAIKEAPDSPMEYFVTMREERMGEATPPARRAILLANDAEAFLVYIRMSQRIISPKPEEILPNIKIPTLMFAGENDPWFSSAQKTAALIPGARFVSLPGLDHGQTMQASDKVIPLVKEFLAQLN